MKANIFIMLTYKYSRNSLTNKTAVSFLSCEPDDLSQISRTEGIDFDIELDFKRWSPCLKCPDEIVLLNWFPLILD